MLHQVGVSFDLYCDARKHRIKICEYRYRIMADVEVLRFIFFLFDKDICVCFQPVSLSGLLQGVVG